jgi:hypothetical protein
LLGEIFGPRVFDTLEAKITEEYLGEEMDLASALIKRPDLFERAIVSILGSAGVPALGAVLDKLQNKLDLGDCAEYSKLGDFPDWMASVTRGL